MQAQNVKHFIVLGENSSLAMKFNPVDSVCMIGGYVRHEEHMITIIREYFGVEEVDPPKYVTRNKIKFTFECSWNNHRCACLKLQNSLYNVVPTNKHGRLMR